MTVHELTALLSFTDPMMRCGGARGSFSLSLSPASPCPASPAARLPLISLQNLPSCSRTSLGIAAAILTNLFFGQDALSPGSLLLSSYRNDQTQAFYFLVEVKSILHRRRLVPFFLQGTSADAHGNTDGSMTSPANHSSS